MNTTLVYFHTSLLFYNKKYRIRYTEFYDTYPEIRKVRLNLF